MNGKKSEEELKKEYKKNTNKITKQKLALFRKILPPIKKFTSE